MSDTKLEFVDRYSATGTPLPNPDTMCDDCEGMGCYPVRKDTEDEADKALWIAHDKERRNARAFFRALWRHKELWFWRSMFSDLWRYGIRNWGCDDWHFVVCPTCNGSRLRD
jgi:hypothetical protein